jgi:hypothetical protein
MSSVDGCVLAVCSGANGRFRPLADWPDEAARERHAWLVCPRPVSCVIRPRSTTRGSTAGRNPAANGANATSMPAPRDRAGQSWPAQGSPLGGCRGVAAASTGQRSVGWVPGRWWRPSSGVTPPISAKIHPQRRSPGRGRHVAGMCQRTPGCPGARSECAIRDRPVQATRRSPVHRGRHPGRRWPTGRSTTRSGRRGDRPEPDRDQNRGPGRAASWCPTAAGSSRTSSTATTPKPAAKHRLCADCRGTA